MLEVEDVELLDDEVMLELDALEMLLELELEEDDDEVLDDTLLMLLVEEVELILDELLLLLALLIETPVLLPLAGVAVLPPEQANIIAAHAVGRSALIIE